MLASACTDLKALTFPQYATPKLDGFRCLKVGGVALTRNFKPVPNVFIREWIEANCPDGIDGELTLRHGTFSESAGAIARRGGEPDFLYHAFDLVSESLEQGYLDRAQELCKWDDDARHERVKVVIPQRVESLEMLEYYEEKCLKNGYEGVMIRTASSPYKCGRSSEKEGYLLKIKRFADGEAEVLSTYEKATNTNEATKDAFGRTKRSSHQAGKVGLGILGGYKVKDLETGIEFSVGHNHTLCEIPPAALWANRQTLVGRIIKYKHQPSGAKDAPRFPQFLGFREGWDL